MKPFRRDIGIALVIAVLLIAFIEIQFLTPRKLHGEVIEPPKPMPDFTLQSANGPVSLSSFRGKIVILYFGYTSCPDLCPATLALLRQGLDELGDKSRDVQVIFVSVDWQRDTPELLDSYTKYFRPDFIGLTGTQEQIDSVTKDFGIIYLLNLPDQNGNYSVDHTASVKVLDRDGNLIVIWPFGMQASEITSDLKVLIKRSPIK